MKKNQYSVSIMMGLLVGAAVALLVDNSITAILAGVIAAGITTWTGSLQWSKAREFAVEMAERTNVRDHIRGIISETDRIVKWPLLAIKRTLIVLATDVNARKTTLALLILGFMLILTLFFIDKVVVLTQLTAVIFLYPTAIIFVDIFISTILILVPAILYGPCTSKKAREGIGNSYFRFLRGWFYQLIIDDRGALAATARMLYIRTGNALRILAYPFVLIPWGFVALANNRTGIAALSTMFLSGIHLSAAYFVGGIDAGNVNFWLSLAIAMMVGAVIGRKIGEMKEETFKIPPLPAIRFRHQVELIAG